MASAVTAVFSADSSQFQAELRRMQTMASASASKISSGTITGGHGPRGMTGIIRESTVLAREISMGRGLGRILGSMSLLVQYLKSYSSGAQTAATYSQQLAEGYERLALKAQLAAIAAEKKAIASGEVVAATGLEDAAAVEMATADAARADAAKVAAVAAQEKAAASLEAAAAEETEAVAAETATAASLPLMAIFIAVIAVLAVLYGAYKLVSAIIARHNESAIAAQEAAAKLTLSFEEEANVLKKLENAAEKADEALRKLHETHDDFGDKVKDAMKGMDDYYATLEKLNDLQKDNAMTQVDIDEKMGKITKKQAIQKRAEIEKDALKKKSEIEEKKLYDKEELSRKASEAASKNAQEWEDDALKKQAVVNESPADVERSKELDRLENIESEARKDADEAEKKANKTKPGRERNDLLDEAKNKNAIADFAAERVKQQKSDMKPDELAAFESMRMAREAKSQADSVSKEAKDAAQELVNFRKNNKEVLPEQLKNIDQKAKEQSLSTKESDKGYSLNSQQRIGAYAATPPDFKRLVDAAVRTANNTEPKSRPLTAPPHPMAVHYGTTYDKHKGEANQH